MGGLGSGGLRSGAGRKSKQTALKVLQGSATRAERLSVVAKPAEAVAMPADLPEAQVALWRELAPLAIEARTLTAGTARAFRDLCAAIVARDAMFARVQEDGLTYLKVTVDGSGQEHTEVKAHPLISQHRGMMQRVEAGMVRFRLSPIGKEIAVAEKAADPFEEFDGTAH